MSGRRCKTPRIRRAYNLAQHQNILTTHEKDPTLDVGVHVFRKDALNGVLED